MIGVTVEEVRSGRSGGVRGGAIDQTLREKPYSVAQHTTGRPGFEPVTLQVQGQQ